MTIQYMIFSRMLFSWSDVELLNFRQLKMWCVLVLCLLLFASVPSAAFAERRVALVVGNDRYTSSGIESLKKATNDSRAVAQALRDISFDEVYEVQDADRRQMDRKIREFVRTIGEGDTAFFFYAGHGVAVGSKNYLLPVDFPAISANDDEGMIKDESRTVDSILADIQERAPGRVFMIIDACRNNPLPLAANRGIGRSSGLTVEAPVEGVFMLFSAGFGQSALDALDVNDPNPNSVFTRNLLPLLRQKGLSQVDIAKRLQTDVDSMAKTIKVTQNPAYYDQIAGLYYLNGKMVEAVETQQGTNSNPSGKTDVNELSSALVEWNAIQNTTNKAILEGFLAKYRADPLYSALASEKLKQLAPEQTASLSDVQSSSPGNAISEAVQLPSFSEIQAELKRLGCYNGTVDGKWGNSSKASLASFNKYAKTSFNAEPVDGELIVALKGKAGSICPSECDTGSKLVNGDCQKITCKSSEKLNDLGECVKKPTTNNTVATSQKPKTDTQGSGKKTGGLTCFVFQGSKMCE